MLYPLSYGRDGVRKALVYQRSWRILMSVSSMGSTRCHRSLPLIRMATPYQGAAAGEPPEAQGQVEAPVARGSRLSADRYADMSQQRERVNDA